MVALGFADGIALTVVFTNRIATDAGVVRRVISARLGNRKERRRYAETIEATQPQDDSGKGPR